MKRVILFLIRKRLGLKMYEKFRFTNQTSGSNYYYFTEHNLMKHSRYVEYPSSVSLNWILNDDCEIEKV